MGEADNCDVCECFPRVSGNGSSPYKLVAWAHLPACRKLRCIGATTLAEYRKYIETDAALERRFAQVLVNEPSVPETISILRGIREKYEVHHGVQILDGALIAAATLANRYLTARRLPDSAIDLVDEACARCVFHSTFRYIRF